METQTPTVFLVDDDEATRKMVSRLIESVGLRVEAHASAEEFLAAYNPTRPGCLVLDVRMPGISGLELQSRLNANRIRIPIVFVSGHGDIAMAVQCLQDGAVHFIEKPFREQVLLDAIRRALKQDADCRELAARQTEVQRRLAELTDREHEVLQRVVEGKANKEIAAELGLSIKAVEAHRSRLLKKMGTHRSSELICLLAKCNAL